MTLVHGSVIVPCISALSWYMNILLSLYELRYKQIIIVKYHGSMILPYSIKAKNV